MSCTGITIPCLQIEHQISGLRHRHTRSGADHYGCDDGGAIPNAAGGEDPRAWDTTVKAVLVTLESRMRDILGPDEESSTASQVVNQLFAKGGLWFEMLGPKKAQAHRDLFAGIVGLFRNHYLHRLEDPAPADGGAIIQFVSLLLKMLDDLERDAGTERS